MDDKQIEALRTILYKLAERLEPDTEALKQIIDQELEKLIDYNIHY